MTAKTRTHIQYRLRSGTLVPGVTTVLNLLDKPAIHSWIARVTKEDYDWKKYRPSKFQRMTERLEALRKELR